MTDGEKQTCATCHYWRGEMSAGACHRRAPAEDRQEWPVPLYGEKDWCGEYQVAHEIAIERQRAIMAEVTFGPVSGPFKPILSLS